VKLQVLTVWDPNYTTCDADITAQLRELPENLDDIYIRCLDRIEASNEKRSADIAPKVFKWVACAKQPLTQIQAREVALATPQNLPIHTSEVLTNPVTDYCANLVTLDHLTGTVTFPHPTVKDFLCDWSKLPVRLRKYHVALEVDDLWLGEICLAYIKVYRSSRSLVRFRKATIDSRIPSSLLQETISSSLPFRWPRERMNMSRTAIPVPVRPTPTRRGLLGPDFSMHGYMCKYWLEHNRETALSGPTHNLFTEVCLSHDVELQPWTQGADSDVQRYRQTIQHAVMNDHDRLLLVVRDHLAPFKDALWTQVFLHPYPETDSSFLHVAAALGHTGVIPTLLDACGKNLADSQGRSAAAVAAGNYHIIAFSLLAPGWKEDRDDGYWQLQTPAGGSAPSECLFHVCAACGNVDAVTVLRGRRKPSIRGLDHLSQRLFESFLLACFKGHIPVALHLVTLGACPDGYDDKYKPDQHSTSSQTAPAAYGSLDNESRELLLSWKGSSLCLALKMENPTFMENLLLCGARFKSRYGHYDIADVVKHYDGKDDIAGLHKFVEILFVHRDLADRDEFASWPEQVLNSIHRSISPSVASRRWGRYVRLIVQLSGGYVSSKFCLCLERLMVFQSYRNGVVNLLEYIPDDLLVRILGYGWLREEFLLTPTSSQAFCRRGTSRALEALIDCLGFTTVFTVQTLALTRDPMTLSELLECRACKSQPCREMWRTVRRCLLVWTNWPKVLRTVQAVLAQVRSHRRRCPTEKPRHLSYDY